jgi:hypothetical protein
MLTDVETLPDDPEALRAIIMSWSWLFGQFGSGVKVYSGC